MLSSTYGCHFFVCVVRGMAYYIKERSTSFKMYRYATCLKRYDCFTVF